MLGKKNSLRVINLIPITVKLIYAFGVLENGVKTK